MTGISLRAGNWLAAGGSFMLFLTNFLAILLAGGIVFLILGLGRVATRSEHVRVRTAALTLVVAATLLIAVPLSATTYQVIQDALENRAAGEGVARWLDGTPYQVVQVTVNGERVIALVEGSGALKPLAALADELAATLGHPVVVNLRVIQSQLQPSAPP